MLKITDISTKHVTQRPAFKGEQSNNPQQNAEKNVTELPNIKPNDLTVNVPIAYKYTGDLDILGLFKAKTYMLANGQKVIILPKKGPTVVKTYVNVGSMNEPDNLRGISHYIEHNLFNGTQNLKAGEFFNKVNKLGGSTNASTSFSKTDFYISSQLLKKGDLEEKIKLHSDMLQNPNFAPDMLEKERGPVISEISMVMDDPNNIATNRAIKNLFQINSTSSDLIAGRIENIKNVTREEVVDYYNTYYTPNNFTTVITGDVEPEETIGLLSKYFTKQNPQKPMKKKYEELTPIKKAVRVDEVSNNATASTIVLAFSGHENSNTKEKIIVEMLIELLSGNTNARLTKAMEKMHLSVEAGLEKISNKDKEPTAILFMARCTPDKVDTSINTIYKEIHNLQHGEISDKELELVKTRLLSTIDDISESSDCLNRLIGSNMLENDKEYLADYEKILKSVTKADLQNAAKKYLNLNRTSIATVNPPQNANKTAATKISFGRNEQNSTYAKKEIFNLSSVRNVTLPNNLELSIIPNDTDITTFDMKLKCPTPAAIKPGVDAVLSAMLNRGSMFSDKESFFEKAELKGIKLGFAATASGIEVSASTNVKNAEMSLDLAQEVLKFPRLTQENFEFAKQRLKESILKKQKSASDIIVEELFPNLPYMVSNETLLKNIDNITLGDIMGLYSYIMQNAQAGFSSCTPLDRHPETVNMFAHKLSTLPQFNQHNPKVFDNFTPLQNSQIYAQIDERNQADILKCYKFKTNGNLADEAKFRLLNIILGGNPNSRLFTDLREKQKLAYRVRSNYTRTGTTGIMSLSIKTTTDNPEEGTNKLGNLKKSLNGFRNNVDRIMAETVSDEELESAKLYLKTMLLDGVETADGKTSAIATGKTSPYGINAPNIFLEEIDKVTKEDIKAAANYIFSNPSITSIIASQKTLDYFRSDFK